MADISEALGRVLMNPSFEVGGSIGYGQTYAPEGYSNISSQKQDTSQALQAYALMRNRLLGAELGYMKLPEYHSKSYTGDYPAYKGLPEGTYPQTVAGRQDIKARGLYARLNAYGPEILGAEPYLSYGRMRTRTDNEESPIYNDTDHAHLREVTHKTSPLYGVGLNYPLSKNTNLRAEYMRSPGATDDAHTLKRDITMGLIGLGMKF